MDNQNMENAPLQIDLFELFHGLRRSALHLLVPGIVMAVLLAGAMGYRTWSSYSPQYQSTASFSVRVSNSLYAGQQFYNNSAAAQLATVFPHILTSGVLAEQVEARLGISAMPSMSASAMGDTNIFTLTVTSGDPQLSYDVLGCVMEIYPSVAEFVVGPTQLTLLNESGLATEPINSPDYERSIVMGCAMGVVLWLTLSLLYWFAHQTVSTEDEMKRVVNLPCFGRLPVVRGVAKNGRPILDENNDKFGFSESVRLLRVRVEKALAKVDGKVLVVTSTIANEGKTTVSINLATALAQKGKKVLLVDWDVRNPSEESAFGQSGRLGLVEYLRNRCTMERIFWKTEVENLSVVFGGRAVSRPEDLFARKNTRKFMEAARSNFDCVILDTPPCALMDDTMEIAAMADGVLLTVRQDFASRRQILEGVQMLGDSKKPILGCVLNMTTPQLGKRGSGSYHYYGYGYGYGDYGRHGPEEEGKYSNEK